MVKMASNPVRLKLLQMLKSSDDCKFEDSKQWLTELKHWIHAHCPTLQLYIVTGKTVAWLVIMPSADKMEKLQTPDIRNATNTTNFTTCRRIRIRGIR
jgi:hypothetical protein